jgi:hypothetical protein
MTTFSASFDANALGRQLHELSQVDQWGAFGRAITRAGQSMRKQAIQEAQSVLNLPAGPIRDVIEVKRHVRRSMSADLLIRSLPQPIIGFKGTREVKRYGRPAGVSVKVKKSGPRKVIRSAFMATMSSGKILAVERKKLGGGKRVPRLPIKIVYSTNARQALDERPSQTRILEAGLKRFAPELNREIKRRLGGV